MESGIFVKFGHKGIRDLVTGLKIASSEMQKEWDGQAVVVKGVLREYLESVAAELANRHGKPWPGGEGGDHLSSRTGRLTDSIIRSVKVQGTSWATLSGTMGGNKYAAIHEYGGTIVAGKKLMTIPLPAALSSRGIHPPFARQWKNTFVARSKAGNLIIFQKRLGNIIPLYLLVHQVTIPARLGMRDELEKQLPYFISRAVDRVASEFTTKVWN